MNGYQIKIYHKSLPNLVNKINQSKKNMIQVLKFPFIKDYLIIFSKLITSIIFTYSKRGNKIMLTGTKEGTSKPICSKLKFTYWLLKPGYAMAHYDYKSSF